MALLTGDGRVLEWWTDIERTIESFARFSRRDAQTLRRWHDEFVPIVAHILAPGRDRRRCRRASATSCSHARAAGRRLLEVGALPSLEFVEKEFEHPTIKAGLLFFNGLREVDLRAWIRSPHRRPAGEPRQGADVAWRLGGAGTRARGSGARERRRPAADDRAEAHPDRGRANGRNRDHGGRADHGPLLVASCLNPQQTFLDLLDQSLLPRELRDLAERFQLQPPRPAVRAQSEPARATALPGERRSPPAGVCLHADHGTRPRRPVRRDRRHHEAGTVPPT